VPAKINGRRWLRRTSPFAAPPKSQRPNVRSPWPRAWLEVLPLESRDLPTGGLGFANVSVFATGSVTLGSDSRVLSGDVVVN
jgi:hypothetical protein